MHNATRPIRLSVEPAGKAPTPRQEIDAIQLHSLSKLIPRNRTTFLHRAASRIEEDFLGQPLHKKIWFLTYALRWALARLRRRIAALGVAPPEWGAGSSTGFLRVAVHGTGSLGDFLSHMMFIQEFHRRYGPMQIDFFCHPRKVAEAKFIFGQARFVNNVVNVNYLPRVRESYDLIISSRYLIEYKIMKQWRILEHNADLANDILEAQLRFEPYHFIFDSHPFLDGVFARSIASEGMNLADAVGYLGNVNVDRKTIPYFCANADCYDIVKRCGLAGKRYITVHDGTDPTNILLGDSATKNWPIDHWNRFVSLVKEKYPDLLVVQLGSSNSRKIEGADLDLRKKTTLDEMAWILKFSSLHVDGESGLVRLAAALQTMSVVLFGPTSFSFFGIDSNINLVSHVCNDCWWSTQSWLNSCPRGLAKPECMESIKPDRVASAVINWLETLSAASYKMEGPSLYGDDGIRDRLSPVLADMFRTLHLPAVPISLHTENRDTGVYLHASKQWEYLKAWDVIEAMSVELGRPLKIACVGDGRGAIAGYLAIKGHATETFDLTYLFDHGGDLGIEHRYQIWAAEQGLNVQYGSPYNIPAKSGAYDVVLSVSELEHLLHKDLAINEALRLLRPGGKLFLSFDIANEVESVKDLLRVEILTPEQLKSELSAIGITQEPFSRTQIAESAACICGDKVLGIPAGMTVGSVVIARVV